MLTTYKQIVQQTFPLGFFAFGFGFSFLALVADFFFAGGDSGSCGKEEQVVKSCFKTFQKTVNYNAIL